MQKTSLLFSCLLLIYISGMAHAEVKTITVTQSYKMSENDSRNEARRICSAAAAWNALKQAEPQMAALDAARHYRLSPDEIRTCTAAALTVKTANQTWLEMAVTMTATIDIDTDYAEKLISRIKSDASLQNQFKEQQLKREELARTLATLQNKLKQPSLLDADDLRKERNTVIRDLNAIEATRAEIIGDIVKKSLEAKKRVSLKMTMKNVKSLLGESDAKTYETYPPQNGKTYYVWYYGYTRIYFEGPLVEIVQ